MMHAIPPNEPDHEEGCAAHNPTWKAVATVAFCTLSMTFAVVALLHTTERSTVLVSPSLRHGTRLQVPRAIAMQLDARHPPLLSGYPSSASRVRALNSGSSTQSTKIFQGGQEALRILSPLLFVLALIGAAVFARKHKFAACNAKNQDNLALMVTTAEVDRKFPPLKNDTVLKAIKGEEVDRIPIWVMRQTGRYLPEYREFTKDKEFFSRCRSPEVACELTLQPFRRFDLDAGIIFSDILVVPQALGLQVSMVRGMGPVFARPLRTKEQWLKVERDMLSRYGVTDASPEASADLCISKAADFADALGYVYDAITLTRTKLDGRAPLIGFTGSPWTLFVYVTEGRKTKSYTQVSKWVHCEEEFSHRILKVMSHVCAQYLIRQVEAGAQILQVFDSHANVLPPKEWAQFSLPYLNMVAEIVKKECPDIPMICLPKNAHFAVDYLTDSPYDMVSIDPTLDLGEVHRKMTAVGKGVQGNMAPTALYAPKEKVSETVKETLEEAFGDGSVLPKRYIFNLGSGMNPDMDPENLGAIVEAVHDFGKK